MNFIYSFLLLSTQLGQPMVIFDFKKTADITDWMIVDDVVMGGRSNGEFFRNKDGNGIFQGTISLENNGGFSSVRYSLPQKNVEGFSKVKLYVKGDGKQYQCRIKTKANDYYSYVASFNTSNEWATHEIPFSSMYPSFRGQTLDVPNYPGKQIEEIAFLIGNKKAESFKLEIDNITLE